MSTSLRLHFFSFVRLTRNVVFSFPPGIPFAPDYQNKQGQISEGYFSRVDVPRAHSDGLMVLPWGLNYTLHGVGSLKHSWSNKVKADFISAYVRGTLFLPQLPPIPVSTVTWFQAWDNAGKGVFAFPL